MIIVVLQRQDDILADFGTESMNSWLVCSVGQQKEKKEAENSNMNAILAEPRLH